MSDEGFSRLEIALKPELFDAAAELIKFKANNYLNLPVDFVRFIRVLSADDSLDDSVKKEFQEYYANPVTEVSSWYPLAKKDGFDFASVVTYKPGVQDPPGNNAGAVLNDLLSRDKENQIKAYSAELYTFKGKGLKREDINLIGKEILANDTIQNFTVFGREEWNDLIGIGNQIPEVELHPLPMTIIPYSEISDEKLKQLSNDRNLALAEEDIPVIRKYFTNKEFIEERKKLGLEGMTDVELETIAQRRSDHCNHNTFRGRFHYKDMSTGEKKTIDNLFKECIETPTLKIKEGRTDIESVLEDNAGVANVGNGTCYVVTGETHNSPTNMEAYGGAITGIVGIYRDPMGTGKGAQLILGMYQYSVATQGKHKFQAKLHPRRLLDGAIEGVRDGGNKSGVPSVGFATFDDSYLGKCLLHVYAFGVMPEKIKGEPSYKKEVIPGDLIIMSGGRVGKDGIHGVTAASETYSKKTPAGHVQIGDPYTQKKMMELLLEARDEDLINFITDNGGGGLSSSIGESACLGNGALVDLDKTPLKYEGLEEWEKWVSESQERMTIGINPKNLGRFMELSDKHGVESTVLGEYTNSGALHITSNGKTVAWLPNKFFDEAFEPWQFRAEWTPPEMRGLTEPELKQVENHGDLFRQLLQMPNIASNEWIGRQKDHEVQALMVVKPFIGVNRDILSDAVVTRTRYDSDKGVAVSQAVNQKYSKIDAREMAASAIDETIRGVLAVGGDINTLTFIDNFCWPTIKDSLKDNDQSFKAAQLVRACEVLRDMQYTYNAPLLSGKDSMYIDGTVTNQKTGEIKKVSGLESMLCTAHAIVHDVNNVKTSDAKKASNLLYVVGTTKNELGGSEYYDMLGHVGLNVPKTTAGEYNEQYHRLQEARDKDYAVGINEVKKAGLMWAVTEMMFGGEDNFGAKINLKDVLTDSSINKISGEEDKVMYSESTGRFVVEVRPRDKEKFEAVIGKYASCIGEITDDEAITVYGFDENQIMKESTIGLKKTWQTPNENRGYVKPLNKIKQARLMD